MNFDGATLSRMMLERDLGTGLSFGTLHWLLLEKGNARVLAFDFGFTPKSMSSMVPRENTFRSDAAMGELVLEISDRVVLGCLFPVSDLLNQASRGECFRTLFQGWFFLGFRKLIIPESPTYPSSIIWMVNILVVSVPSRFLLIERLMRFLAGSHYGSLRRGKLMPTTYWEVREASWSLNCRWKNSGGDSFPGRAVGRI